MIKSVEKLLKSQFGPFIAMVCNIIIAYAVYFIARVAYFLENYSLFADHLSWNEALQWMHGGYMFDTVSICYSLSLYIVLMLLPWAGKETATYHKVCKWLFIVVNTITLIMNLADSVYYPFTLRRTMTNVLQEFENENNLGGIFFTELINHWYFIVLVVLLVWAMHRLYVMPRTRKVAFEGKKAQLQFSGINFLLLAITAFVVVGGIRGGWQSGVRPITISNANQYVSNPKDCALVLNTPFSLIRTIGKNDFREVHYFASEADLEAVFTPIHTPADTLQMNKRNVVVLIVESFAREYIGALNKDIDGGNYKGFTPNVDKLIEKSLVFEHAFSNGRKSIDGMPSVLCGIPMFITPFVLTPSSMNTHTSLAGILAQEGYSTSFFHGANRGSMGFLAFSKKVGFSEYYGRQDYADDPRFGGDADFDGNWGIWDEPFLQYWAAKIGEMQEPFVTSCFTVSSHHPFVIPDKYKDTYKGGPLPIHKCIEYTDMAIGKFFEAASKEKWFENTIFVITNDHTNQGMIPEYQTDLGVFGSNIIIYDPKGEIAPGVSKSIAQQIDILPTILSALNYNKPFLAFGEDLLTTPTEDTYAVNYLNGIYQYIKHGLVLQFDGEKTKAVYSLDDRLMENNIIGQSEHQAEMERELKAIVQQYMDRMVNDRLMP